MLASVSSPTSSSIPSDPSPRVTAAASSRIEASVDEMTLVDLSLAAGQGRAANEQRGPIELTYASKRSWVEEAQPDSPGSPFELGSRNDSGIRHRGPPSPSCAATPATACACRFTTKARHPRGAPGKVFDSLLHDRRRARRHRSRPAIRGQRRAVARRARHTRWRGDSRSDISPLAPRGDPGTQSDRDNV